MKKLNLLLIFLGAFVLFGCDSEDDDMEMQPNGTLIFGWYGDSRCSGSCTTMYKIENERVYKDVGFNPLDNTFFEGDFELMTDVDYQQFEAVLIELPNELFNEPNGCLSTVDCNDDFGGFYLEYKKDDGFHKSWRFNQRPEYIVDYRSLLLDKLAQLNSL